MAAQWSAWGLLANGGVQVEAVDGWVCSGANKGTAGSYLQCTHGDLGFIHLCPIPVEVLIVVSFSGLQQRRWVSSMLRLPCGMLPPPPRTQALLLNL